MIFNLQLKGAFLLILKPFFTVKFGRPNQV